MANNWPMTVLHSILDCFTATQVRHVGILLLAITKCY